MKKTKYFGIPIEEIRRQWAIPMATSDYNHPINKGETLEACIRGGEKICEDMTLRKVLKEIYRQSEEKTIVR